MSAKVTILILNWNNYQDTAQCLHSLRGLSYQDSKVVLLDNGSTDGSLERIQREFPNIETMALGSNLGFAKGNNAGIRAAMARGADYVWLLNNDTLVEPGALSTMVQLAESDLRIGAVGSALYSMTEPRQLTTWGGGRVDFWFGRSLPFGNAVADERIEFITGASLFLRRAAVEAVGMLDENFFMYWEDADYGWRLRRAGWKLAVARDAEVWHKEQGTIGKRSVTLDVYFNRSAIRFFRKHAPLPLIPILGSVPRRLARWALRGEWSRIRSVWGTSGLMGSLRRIPE